MSCDPMLLVGLPSSVAKSLSNKTPVDALISRCVLPQKILLLMFGSCAKIARPPNPLASGPVMTLFATVLLVTYVTRVPSFSPPLSRHVGVGGIADDQIAVD